MASGPTASRPDGHTLTFSNGCNLLTFGSIYTKLGDFIKLGLPLKGLSHGILSYFEHRQNYR